jgi:HIV Tat-specific factor 1
LKRLKRKRHAENKKKKWFEATNNTYIYVQGLPKDIKEEELSVFFKKCGIIKLDPSTG